MTTILCFFFSSFFQKNKISCNNFFLYVLNKLSDDDEYVSDLQIFFRRSNQSRDYIRDVKSYNGPLTHIRRHIYRGTHKHTSTQIYINP